MFILFVFMCFVIDIVIVIGIDNVFACIITYDCRQFTSSIGTAKMRC